MPTTTPLYSVKEIRAIEQAARIHLPQGTLMQRAGQAAAHSAMMLLGAEQIGADIAVLAGPGNNGGDAIVAAHLLMDAGMNVTVLLCGDLSAMPADAAAAFQQAQGSDLRFVKTDWSNFLLKQNWDLVIDGLFGIGLTRPISGVMRTLVESVNTLACPILALDIPSGLEADTGNVIGDNGIAVMASHTITFIAGKPGLYTGEGRDYAGQVQIETLEVDPAHYPPPSLHLTGTLLFTPYFKRRKHSSHKGTYGDVVVLGGTRGTAGAPILSARAALHCGAGRVYATFLEAPPSYDSVHPEIMCRIAREMDMASTTIIAGPGLGTSREAHAALSKILDMDNPIVIDADALNLIATEQDLQSRLFQYAGPVVITPHPLEAARLLGMTAKAIQHDRLGAARHLAQKFNVIVVLKGSGTVIARPSGEAVINTTGNPALATAGTGDVLAGVLGALLAQGMPAWQAALAGTWLHGRAADVLVSEGVGPIGLTAGELIPYIRALLNQLTEEAPQHTKLRRPAAE